MYNDALGLAAGASTASAAAEIKHGHMECSTPAGNTDRGFDPNGLTDVDTRKVLGPWGQMKNKSRQDKTGRSSAEQDG